MGWIDSWLIRPLFSGQVHDGWKYTLTVTPRHLLSSGGQLESSYTKSLKFSWNITQDWRRNLPSILVWTLRDPMKFYRKLPLAGCITSNRLQPPENHLWIRPFTWNPYLSATKVVAHILRCNEQRKSQKLPIVDRRILGKGGEFSSFWLRFCFFVSWEFILVAVELPDLPTNKIRMEDMEVFAIFVSSRKNMRKLRVSLGCCLWYWVVLAWDIFSKTLVVFHSVPGFLYLLMAVREMGIFSWHWDMQIANRSSTLVVFCCSKIGYVSCKSYVFQILACQKRSWRTVGKVSILFCE